MRNSTHVAGNPRAYTTLRAAMSAFDALPPRLRQLYNYAPVDLDPGPAYREQHLYNFAARYEAVFWAHMAKVCPRWHPRLKYDGVER